MEEARFYAAGGNVKHGLRRTPGDKRKAVAIVLLSKRSAVWTDRRIADYCSVDPKTVNSVRLDLGNGKPAYSSEPDQVGKSSPAKKSRETKAKSQKDKIKTGPTKRIGKDGKKHPADKPKSKSGKSKAGHHQEDRKACATLFGKFVRLMGNTYTDNGQKLSDLVPKELEGIAKKMRGVWNRK
jgi:hypothetical protein